jgi:hypothetical protein
MWEVDDPASERRRCFRVVGDGHVHGIMYGLAFTFVEMGYVEMKDVC